MVALIAPEQVMETMSSRRDLAPKHSVTAWSATSHSSRSTPQPQFWAGVAALTLRWPDWIERVFGVSPYRGSGLDECSSGPAAFSVAIAIELLGGGSGGRNRSLQPNGVERHYGLNEK
jgi:hypothetical protein